MIERIKSLFARKAQANEPPAAPKIDSMKLMRDMARAAPPPSGPMARGNIANALGTDMAVICLFDNLGRVFQITGANITGGEFTPVNPARTAVMKMMDHFETSDFTMQAGAMSDD